MLTPRRRRRSAHRLSPLPSPPILRAAALLALISLAAACATSSSSSATASGSAGSGSAPVSVTIAYAAPVADQMIASVTQAAGLFAKNGIDAKVEFLQASQLLPALVSGQVQFGTFAAPGPEIATVNGHSLKYIAQWENSFDTVFVASKKYPTMASLNGKAIAISSDGAFSDLLARIAERRYGITMRELPLGNLTNQIAAFESGSADAVSDLSPWQLSSAQQKVPGAHSLIDWRTITNIPGMGLVGNDQWLTANRATAVKVLKAISEGVSYFKTHPTEAIKVISQVTSEPTAEATASYQAVLKSLTPTIVPSLAAQQNLLTYLPEMEPAAKGYPASKLLDASYAEAAIGS